MKAIILVFLTVTIFRNISCSGSGELQAKLNLKTRPHNREKRFALFDKLKKIKIFQKRKNDGLSAPLEYLWHTYMKMMHHEFIKPEGDNVEFPCDNRVTYAILHRYPKSSFRWNVNGGSVALDASRMFLLKGTFQIRNLRPEDAGVYVCYIVYHGDNFKTVGIFPLTVHSQTVTHIVPETDDIKLRCNSNIFFSLFRNISIEWYFQGTKHDTPLKGNASDVLIVKNAKKSFAGVWECLIKDPVNKRIWHNAWYKVGIDPPPPIYLQFYKLVKDNKLLTLLAVLGVLIISLVVLGICVCTAEKVKAKNERTMGSMKDRVMSMQGNNLFGIKNLNLEAADDNKTDDSVTSDTFSLYEETSSESARLLPLKADSY